MGSQFIEKNGFPIKDFWNDSLAFAFTPIFSEIAKIRLLAEFV